MMEGLDFCQIFLVSMLGGFSWICRGFFSAVGSKTSREIDEKIEDHFKNPGGFHSFGGFCRVPHLEEDVLTVI